MNVFSQSKDTFKVILLTEYRSIEIVEEVLDTLFNEDLLGISTSEVSSKTIEALPEDIWCIEAYLNHSPQVLVLGKITRLAAAKSVRLFHKVTCEKVEDQDWVSHYRQNLKPTVIGKFFISSLIHKGICPPDKSGVYIEATRAFGTGEHATTSGCIEAITALSTYPFHNILDLGCGTGILSFVAEKIWREAEVFSCDIEEVAIQIAKQNAIINESNVFFYQNTEEQILPPNSKDLKFDLVISNILATPLIGLAQEISQITKPQGYVVLSGFLNYQMQEVIEAYNHVGFELIAVANKQSWVISTFKLK